LERSGRARKIGLLFGMGVLLSNFPSHSQNAAPLTEHVTIKVGVPAQLLQNAAVILADDLGELKKENISIEYVIQRPSDGLVLLSTGRIDVLVSQPSAAFFNAVAAGSELKMVYPAGFWAPEGKTGFWVNKAFLNGRKYSPDLLKGQAIAVTAGPGSLITEYVQTELTKAGLDLNAVSWKTMNISDILIALENGAVNFGVLIDPIPEKADPSKVEFAFAAGSPDQGISGAYFFGHKLLTEQRKTGEAFVRALVRTVHTDLSGDYRSNPKVVATLAKRLGLSEEQVRTGSRLIFDEVKLRDDTATRVQKTYSLTPGLLSYNVPLTSDQVMDRTFSDLAQTGPQN
jgi:NitT/TauT family transport system substrate-binding protein